MVYVQKKERESVEGMLRRFRKKLQRSGKIWLVRKRRYREVVPNSRLRRERALRRITIRKKIEHLKRLGKMSEIRPKRRGRR